MTTWLQSRRRRRRRTLSHRRTAARRWLRRRSRCRTPGRRLLRLHNHGLAPMRPWWRRRRTRSTKWRRQRCISRATTTSTWTFAGPAPTPTPNRLADCKVTPSSLRPDKAQMRVVAASPSADVSTYQSTFLPLRSSQQRADGANWYQSINQLGFA